MDVFWFGLGKWKSKEGWATEFGFGMWGLLLLRVIDVLNYCCVLLMSLIIVCVVDVFNFCCVLLTFLMVVVYCCRP